MKKLIALVLALMMTIALIGCQSKTTAGVQVFVSSGRGDVSEVWIEEVASEIYTPAELEDGIDTVLDYFKSGYGGCSLWELQYVGDENLETYKMAALRSGSDQVMAFSTVFDVAAAGEDSALVAGSVYFDYVFILAYVDDEWQVVSMVDEE